jgi:mannose-1-phosphate guanylyltransferase
MNWAIIMAGGSGTRFWPESRKSCPKQFLSLFGRQTLLEQTFHRLQKFVPRDRILVFVSESKVALARQLLKIPAGQVIGEPMGRNTAPCALWAASYVMRKDPSAVLGIFPADHYIRDEKAFTKAIRLSYGIAGKKGMPVTLGICPGFPHTGYGYLEMGRRLAPGVFYLKQFREKPDLPSAKKYLRSKRFLWNAGIFIWRADCLLETGRQYLPAAFKIATTIAGGGCSRTSVKRLFSRCPAISIDYGLMEKMTGQILTVPVSMGWNDVGGWASLKKLLARRSDDNVTQGKTLLVESSGNFVRSQTKLIATVGLKDHVIIETPDSILVCPMKKTEEIRKIVSALEIAGMGQFL